MLQTGGPRLDLSFLVPERVNPAFDPNKAIGGENVPYQESKGVGGFFRRLLGDESNRMNIEAQQAQGAEWRAEEKAAKQRAERKQDLEDEIALREAGPAARFEKTEERLAKSEADRVAAENKRLELEGQRLGLTKQQIEDARQDRIARLQAEKEERDIRIENMRTQNALADAAFGQSMLKSNQPSMTGLPGGGLAVMDPRSGSISIVNPGMQGFGTMPGTPATTRQVYPQVKAPPAGGAQVDRATGATMGGRLPAEADKPAASATIPTSPRNTIMPISEGATRTSRKVPIPEEESIDPYQLQRTTPSMGTMIEPAGSSVSNRARYMSTNMSGWRVEPQAPAPIIPGPIPASLSMASAAKKPAVDGTIEYPTVMGDSSVGPFRGPVQSLPLPQGPENLNVSQQYYSNLLQSADPNDVEYTNWLKEKLRNARF
jgi:hypothetical protein